MIGFLKGTCVAPGVVLADGTGVGYAIATPHTMHPGEHVSLYVITQVRQDAIALYGFASTQEQQCFRALVKLQGVGPQVALNVLRDVGVSGVASKSADVLAKAQGVGAKLAAKIAASIDLPVGLDVSEVPSQVADVANTLTELGYPAEQALGAVRSVLEECGPLDDGDLLAAALAQVVRL